MKKIINYISFRPKLRRFLTTFYHKNLSADIEFQLRMRALDSTCEYIESNMVDVPMYGLKTEVIDNALKNVSIDGEYCEFGVFKGASVNYMAKRIKQEIHAFDSFEGLPETWLSTHEKGHFKVKVLPVFEKNVVVHKGWFNETLPPWNENNSSNIALLHIDSDLYSSAKTILTELDSRIVAGTIIMFDEYFNYPFWQQHEYKAFCEFIEKNNVKYEYLCYNSNSFGSKVAVKILDRA